MQCILLFIIVFIIVYTIYALTNNHENVFCDPTECATCPFPHEGCRHRCELFWSDLMKMDGTPIYVDLDGRLILMRVSINNVSDVYLVSERGAVTTYDDIEKVGGKFFKKFSKIS